MIERYEDETIAKIWSDQNKVALWEATELAVIKAREHVEEIAPGIYEKIEKALQSNRCNLKYWKEREEVLHHDLNAWLEERTRFIPNDLQQYFHQGLTSFDTEEPAFATNLKYSILRVRELMQSLRTTLQKKALQFRFTPMNKRTHGQEAEMGSFGCRCLTWHQEFAYAESALLQIANKNLQYSKLSGAIGAYSGLHPEIERVALKLLNLEPFYGATQIMPRVLYAPLASALADMVAVLDKIALDIRLGARSGRPLWHEPFGKKQKGSSAMPHKKNTINTEKVAGMARMARTYANGISLNIQTWEERAIEQSSVERVFWPDIFHVAVHALQTMQKVLSGLVVYPENMMQEIIESRGCYASNEAKEFLITEGARVGIDRETAYRIVQLASFNAFWGVLTPIPESPEEADSLLEKFLSEKKRTYMLAWRSLDMIISTGRLHHSDQLEVMPYTIDEWNRRLIELFVCHPEVVERWSKLFLPSHSFERENFLFEEVFISKELRFRN